MTASLADLKGPLRMSPAKTTLPMFWVVSGVRVAATGISSSIAPITPVIAMAVSPWLIVFPPATGDGLDWISC